MTAAPTREECDAAVAYAREALRMVSISLPHLAGLAHQVRVHASPKVPTAGIFRTGRLVIAPGWFLALDRAEATFVMAHELMHLLLRTHQRAEGADAGRFNVAHDAVINDSLAARLGMAVPKGGVAIAGARFMSAEALLRTVAPLEGPHWRSVDATEPPTYEEDALPDWRDEELLGEALGRLRVSVEAQRTRAGAWESIAISLWDAEEVTPEDVAPLRRLWPHHRTDALVRAASWYLPNNWEAALQQWIEGVAPSNRSYARASRRAGMRADVALAGRRREGSALHVLLDTSTSMTNQFERVLGALRGFCEAANVTQLRVVQTDNVVVRDEWITPDELGAFAVISAGDGELLVQPRPCENCSNRHALRPHDAPATDLSNALRYLAEQGEAEAVLVFTDGYIELPSERPGYEVLWALTVANECFRPPWGRRVSPVPDRV